MLWTEPGVSSMLVLLGALNPANLQPLLHA
jgi:hypothetical protein